MTVFLCGCPQEKDPVKPGPDGNVGVSVKLGEEDWRTYSKASAHGDGNGGFDIYWETDDIQSEYIGTIAWKGKGTGTYSWVDNGSNDTDFEFLPPDQPSYAYEGHYETGETVIESPGAVTITRWGNVGERVEGTFVVERSGKYDIGGGNGDYVGEVRITGKFSVIREQ